MKPEDVLRRIADDGFLVDLAASRGTPLDGLAARLDLPAEFLAHCVEQYLAVVALEIRAAADAPKETKH